jgi:hypothetical protein
MASFFKSLQNNDILTNRTLLHEAIPITGALVSGTYNRDGSLTAELNIKNYSHGMFQSVYDYPYLSSSANHIFDITVGYSTGSAMSGNIKSSTATPLANRTALGTGPRDATPVARTQQEKKIQIYNQMAQVLMGHDKDGKIRRFDQDGELTETAGPAGIIQGKIDEAYFISFSRLLVKDEIKKGSFQMELGVDPNWHQEGDLRRNTSRTMIIKDTGASTSFKINSPAGEYGILSASSGQASGSVAHGHTTGSKDGSGNVLGFTTVGGRQMQYPTKPHACGLVFYQAGVVVLDARIFALSRAVENDPAGHADPTPRTVETGIPGIDTIFLTGGLLNSASCVMRPGNTTDKGMYRPSYYNHHDIYAVLTGSTIQTACDGLRHRIKTISFNNTTELNSTIYFCRANHNEFNYSSNPTYIQNSKIAVKNINTDMPISYITTIGLYSPDNELMAAAKLSEPLRKDPTNELTLRVRLDY